MNASISLSLFESVRILFEAAATENELFRIIDEDIRKNFFIEGDPTMQAEQADEVNDVAEIFRTVSAAEARRITGNEEIPDVEDNDAPANPENNAPNGNNGTISIVDYIRAKAIETLTYPSTHPGCMGIGNSREAKIRLGKFYGSKQKPKPLDPKNPAGKWILPPDEPAALSQTKYALVSNPDQLPPDFKNYISLVARQYLPGLIRIAFEDCGLASYLFYTFGTLKRALLIYYGERFNNNSNNLYKFLREEFPPEWDYNRMFHLAHIVIPQLVIKSKLAPMEATPNCDKGLLKQNIDYLGKNNVELIQELFDPIETPVGPNIDMGGSHPLSYKNLLKLSDVNGVNPSQGIAQRMRRPDGTLDYYIPPETNKEDDKNNNENEHIEFQLTGPVITDEMRQSYTDNVLNEKLRKEASLEFPSVKIGDWYVEQVGNGVSDADTYQDGWFTFNEPSAGERHQFIHRTPNDEYGEGGVGFWCWTRGMLENYRSSKLKDVAYALVHKSALDPAVLKDTTWNNRHNGTRYDASAFGIVIAGGKDTNPGEGYIPGLVKADCFESRNNTTYESGRPGRPSAVSYPPDMVPYGGKIPGLVPITDSMSNRTMNTAQAINNSIFSLALIGKWDPSINVCDADGTLHPENLIPLMQKWFPADISDADLLPATDNVYNKPIRIKSIDINEMANDIEHIITTKGTRVNGFHRSRNDTSGDTFKFDDSIFRGNVFQLKDTDYSVLAKNDATLIAVPTEVYDSTRKNCDGQLENILFFMQEDIDPPALLFFYFNHPGQNKHVVPFQAEPIALSDALSINVDSVITERQNDRMNREKQKNQQTLPTPDEHGINWYAPILGETLKKNRIGVDIKNGGKVYLSGPDTNNEPVPIECKIPGRLRTFSARGSFIKVGDSGYNLFFNAQRRSYIGYVRNNKTAWFEVLFRTTFRGTDNALLSYIDNEGERVKKLTLGNIYGNLANRMRMDSKDRYTGCIDWVSTDETIDDVNLSYDFENEQKEHHPNDIGLCVIAGDFNGDANKAVGYIDWYSTSTLEYLETVPVFLYDLYRND